ncbi:hypothetical protein H6P81_006624 [Aristolochia fimbriata]|uniref:Rab-GAP TBC domain-containing protein n=1 Tax=Aristolochia fimbriata TaxID=158543 RepID=A0AAV7EXU7_ARIFI|nr:hypothetical protein H6P81_006624 [Aristolochia fimbriata]
MKTARTLPVITFEHKRDVYGFAVRPQHLHRYKEYANIYKEEEEERSERWKNFLERQAESAEVPLKELSLEQESTEFHDSGELQEPKQVQETAESVSGNGLGQDHLDRKECDIPTELASDDSKDKEERLQKGQIWAQIRPSLSAIEQMMSFRVKKRKTAIKGEQEEVGGHGSHLPPIEEAKPARGVSEDDSEDEFYDVERSDPVQDVPSNESTNAPSDGHTAESFYPWKEELECLVQGGVPMALRGEIWQAFVGVRTRRVENYYQDLLAVGTSPDNCKQGDVTLSDETDKEANKKSERASEKWKGQIEKDLPRTFPGHPALDENGRNALRRLLTAYARHNPSVGYCQAMNFFAGLLLLLMPEENAFWTLMGIIDDYFDGYYTEEMIESQVDQLVFEEIVHEKFPKLVNHLDFLGVQVAWVTGPWFLSIFVNMLPWESVLRVWDVLLFEGNRVMLFRTALAVMELYGPTLVTTKDAGDAVTLLQSLAGSTFDSSQLVLTACMGYQSVKEERLQELRKKHRPAVLAIIEERAKGLRVYRDSQGLASKLYSFKHDPGSIMQDSRKDGLGDTQGNGDLSLSESQSRNLDDFLNSLEGESDVDSVPDLQEQIVWLKVELCKLLEEKRSAILRAEELETALMEMVKQDNRRLLSARVEQLEQEVGELKQALADKQEQEHAMLQVLMRVEQEQRVTEDARISAEQDAAAQRYATHVLQEKYEEAMASLAAMEKRVVMAETMLEATLQYQNGQGKAQQAHVPSPRAASSPKLDSAQEPPTRKIGLLSRPFVLGWRDRNKGKSSNAEEVMEGKVICESKSTSEEQQSHESLEVGINGHKEETS